MSKDVCRTHGESSTIESALDTRPAPSVATAHFNHSAAHYRPMSSELFLATNSAQLPTKSHFLPTMAPLKRKADQSAAPAKKDNRPFQDRSAKRQRKSDIAAEDTKSPKPAIEKSQTAPQKSVFKDEEKSFPRGGASVLTPLEHKQIQIKATQDVLFEQSGQKRGGDDGLSDGSDIEMKEAPKAGKMKKSKKGKKGQAAEEEQIVKVEGLSYKVSLRMCLD